jgi:hypothetical protein
MIMKLYELYKIYDYKYLKEQERKKKEQGNDF